jgi:hypothetical protein
MPMNRISFTILQCTWQSSNDIWQIHILNFFIYSFYVTCSCPICVNINHFIHFAQLLVIMINNWHFFWIFIYWKKRFENFKMIKFQQLIIKYAKYTFASWICSNNPIVRPINSFSQVEISIFNKFSKYHYIFFQSNIFKIILCQTWTVGYVVYNHIVSF